MHYSNLFQYFLSMCYGPYSSWKFQFFLCNCLLTLIVNNYYDWWTHAYRIWKGAAQLYLLSSEKWSIRYASLSAMLNLLHSISDQELFEK